MHRKYGQDLIKRISFALPPAPFKENVVSNVKRFQVLYQFLSVNQISLPNCSDNCAHELVGRTPCQKFDLERISKKLKSIHNCIDCSLCLKYIFEHSKNLTECSLSLPKKDIFSSFYHQINERPVSSKPIVQFENIAGSLGLEPQEFNERKNPQS